MSKWRSVFCSIYKLIKSYCSINDACIAEAINVGVSSVRQYSGKRMTMPDNIDGLCTLFEKEINKHNYAEKWQLMSQIRNILPNDISDVYHEDIGQHICAILKYCYSSEKSNAPFAVDVPNHNEPSGHTKAVVFDFDGTLTNTKTKTTWEQLWGLLGHNAQESQALVQECRDLHGQYDKKMFSHQEWCNKTADRFIELKLTRNHVMRVAKDIKLIKGCKETLQALSERNIKLYIVSGSIKEIIQSVLGAEQGFFTDIKANEFIFDTETSILSRIIGTRYDFEGKAQYINHIARRLGVATSDILFIGNSNNDMWAYESGADTLCINPAHTDYHNHTVWHNTIVECKNLSAILAYIK